MQRTDLDRITRRRALRQLGAAGAAMSGLDALLGAAAQAAPARGTLRDIDHVVILIQENRSFDHYFGTYAGVRGFADKRGRKAFFQRDLAGKTIHPFHLGQECLPDITHDWGPQHEAWHSGHMDRFVIAHQQADGKTVGPETMGYYDQRELGFYHALANAFTICDGYHCSVIGPTDPNRLMSMSATVDPGGRRGGPLLHTNVAPAERIARFTWPTMPESLQRKGVSWKVYSDPVTGFFDNVLTYFKQYSAGSALAARALRPSFPHDFLDDIHSGRLPQVSWLLPGVTDTEHPGYSTPAAGQLVTRQIVEALVSNPKVWRRTALFVTWDENGGFFDHVAPPVAPPGTPGEWVTAHPVPGDARGVRGPIGLGFRVPMLVVSPFSRGGLVSPDTYDHTSTLRFLERRFGARVPNLSAWRRKVTGDLTAAFDFAASPRYGRPNLPSVTAGSSCFSPAPVAVHGAFPHQQPGRRRRPSGLR